MSYRSKLLSNKRVKQEQELHIITNPLIESGLSSPRSDDYQAPATAYSLPRNSKWLIVRNNLHKIRSWGVIDASHIEDRFKDWYIFFQMRRELRRTQEQLSTVQNQPNFAPIHYFNLPTDPKHNRRFDVSHVRPTDAVYYPGIGKDPIVTQSLLYYFAKECPVPYGSKFHPFLSQICAIVNRERELLHRATVFRRFALFFTIVISIIIAIMLISMLVSVLQTMSSFRTMSRHYPNEISEWQQTETASVQSLNYL